MNFPNNHIKMKKGRQKPARQGRKAKKKPGGCLLSRHEGSIIGVRELDFRVRYGNGYFLSTMATGHMYICPSRALLAAQAVPADARVLLSLCMGPGSAPRGINNMVKPHDLLVMLG